MPRLRIRWSEHEAAKAYARPFGVAFESEEGASLGAIAVSGADLLYYRQFQVAVMALAGEVFLEAGTEGDPDPQHAWLDRLEGLLPAAAGLRLRPASTFDHDQGRLFHIEAHLDGRTQPARLGPAAVLDYQEFQAALAHQTGRLFRDAAVEAVSEPAARQAAWLGILSRIVERPDVQEAMAAEWPWRAAGP